jgi:hypothetical protein
VFLLDFLCVSLGVTLHETRRAAQTHGAFNSAANQAAAAAPVKQQFIPQ